MSFCGGCCGGHSRVGASSAPKKGKRKRKKAGAPSEPITLKHGGTVVDTVLGYVQYGFPPETLKDSLLLLGEVPSMFVSYGDMFDRILGLNMAELEFITYFSFFVRSCKVTLVVQAHIAERMRVIFRETLLGPMSYEGTLAHDFPKSAPRDAWPNFIEEGRDLGDPKYKEDPLKVSDLINFVVISDDYTATLGDSDEVTIQVNPIAETVSILETGKTVAELPLAVHRGEISAAVGGPNELITTLFEPPEFGVTFVGTSHGFDPAGRTSGFILWIGKRGIIVDPPPYTGDVLASMGIVPRLIDSIILSHCHADHDAGSFQKILRSSNVRLITTTTILGSFLRKYSAISGFSEVFIANLFQFVPVKIGDPLEVHGGNITFQYSLHTIPCLSFSVEYAGKSISFSGDTCYNPELLADMLESGTIGQARYDQLMAFDFDADVILHEAGVPPIHTPIALLAELPPDVRSRLYVIHSSQKTVAEYESLQRAEEGQTVALDVEPLDPKAEIVDLFSHIYIYKDLVATRASIRKLLANIKIVEYAEGDIVFAEGDPPDMAFVVMSGIVREQGAEGQFVVGDYFGELAVIKQQQRHADHYCATDTRLIQIARPNFLKLCRGTDIASHLTRVFENVVDHSVRKITAKHSIFSKMLSSNRVQLEAIMHYREVDEGDVLCRRGEEPTEQFLVCAGQVLVSYPGSSRHATTCESGAFVCNTDAILSGLTSICTVKAAAPDTAVMAISTPDLLDLFALVPGLMVHTLGRIVTL